MAGCCPEAWGTRRAQAPRTRRLRQRWRGQGPKVRHTCCRRLPASGIPGPTQAATSLSELKLPGPGVRGAWSRCQPQTRRRTRLHWPRAPGGTALGLPLSWGAHPAWGEGWGRHGRGAEGVGPLPPGQPSVLHNPAGSSGRLPAERGHRAVGRGQQSRRAGTCQEATLRCARGGVRFSAQHSCALLLGTAPSLSGSRRPDSVRL